MTNPFALPPTETAPASTPAPVTAPVQAAPVAQPSAVSDDPFGAPAPQSDRPRVRDMVGRLLLITPLLVETVPNKKKPGETQQRMTADVVVLDGGELHFGGAPEKVVPVPHTKTAPTPYAVRRLYISSVGLVSQCATALHNRLARTGEPMMVLGRLGVGIAKDPDSSPPYLVTDATDAEKVIARAYLAANPQDPFA